MTRLSSQERSSNQDQPLTAPLWGTEGPGLDQEEVEGLRREDDCRNLGSSKGVCFALLAGYWVPASERADVWGFEKTISLPKGLKRSVRRGMGLTAPERKITPRPRGLYLPASDRVLANMHVHRAMRTVSLREGGSGIS